MIEYLANLGAICLAFAVVSLGLALGYSAVLVIRGEWDELREEWLGDSIGSRLDRASHQGPRARWSEQELWNERERR